MAITLELDDIFDELSTEITYTPSGGSATTIDAIIGTIDGVNPWEVLTLTVKYADVSSPSGATFVINSSTWYVREVNGPGPLLGVYELVLTNSPRGM